MIPSSSPKNNKNKQTTKAENDNNNKNPTKNNKKNNTKAKKTHPQNLNKQQNNGWLMGTKRITEMIYLTTLSTHFVYGSLASGPKTDKTDKHFKRDRNKQG